MAMTQGRVAQIINKANFCEINNLLDQGHNMEYITAHFQMDNLALAWAIRLQEILWTPFSFEVLGGGYNSKFLNL